jgi:hypothetical protein
MRIKYEVRVDYGKVSWALELIWKVKGLRLDSFRNEETGGTAYVFSVPKSSEGSMDAVHKNNRSVFSDFRKVQEE